MNKEEQLKQEADKESYKYNKKYSEDYKLKDMLSRPMDFIEGAIEDVVKLLKIKAYRDGYLAGAEPREKRIAELEDKLANADYQLEGRDNEIKELKAQIEEMKCCGNCAKNGHICVAEEMQGKLCGKNKDKWELRR